MSDNGPADLSRAIECLLFASTEPLNGDRLADVLEVAPEQVEEALGELRVRLDARGLQVVALAGGYQLATRPEYATHVHKLLQPPPARLSPQALETLAIVAYRQPITRPEVDALRGVNSQHAMASLTEKGLVTTVGRKDAPGRPLLYATTPHFLSTFGLRDLSQLPSLEQLRQSLRPERPFVLRGVVTESGLDEPEGAEPEQADEEGLPAEETSPEDSADDAQLGAQPEPPSSSEE